VSLDEEKEILGEVATLERDVLQLAEVRGFDKKLAL
jgi:hypothetical protein